MGRFIFNKTDRSENNQIDEHRLRQPEADSDIIGDEYYSSQGDTYARSNTGFRPKSSGYTNNQKSPNNSNQISYLKAEIDFVADGFMRQLIDYQAFAGLDPEIQGEIRNRYPQFFN